MAKPKPTKEDYQRDVLDLSRKILEGVQLRDITWVESLEGQDRINFLVFCTNIVSNPFFEKVFAMLYFPQVEASALRAENYDIVSFHRATANGISLTREFFMKYDRQYKEEFEKDPEKFATEEDANKAFTSNPTHSLS
jgi:hypothetical protein